jgi:hypothetical protein
MNKCTITLLLVLVFSIFAQGDEILIKKWFRNNNTFVIVCKGYPKEGLTGDARVESAKEAALINAQVISRALFNDSVDIFKYGTIEKYKIYRNYVVVYYVIEMNNLRSQMR